MSVECAALDPFRWYRNAIRDELPDAVAVLDVFHIIRLAGNALDEVRRRVQPDARTSWAQGRPALPDPPRPAHRC
ncbi:transposase [Streptomyces inhibens]|uniref:transposase n=1 Tax=Streptomyces inhibens TaxID=2293571 RepID=UPI0036B80717